jgi:hypothetical protein
MEINIPAKDAAGMANRSSARMGSLMERVIYLTLSIPYDL